MNFTKRAKPVIYQVGKVTDDGHRVNVSGWGLTYCVGRCACHVHPSTLEIVLLNNPLRGELGLQKFRACYCCEPWSFAELRGFLRDLAEIEALGEITEQPT